MFVRAICLLSLSLFLHADVGLCASGPRGTGTQIGDVSILAANDLSTSNAENTSAAILIGISRSKAFAQQGCLALSEKLWSPEAEDFNAGLNSSLAYEVYSGRWESTQQFWISPWGRQCRAISVDGNVSNVTCTLLLPALCTQSAPPSTASFANTSTAFQVAQFAGNQTLVGFRDFYSFRFMGVRFAAEPKRFTYSTPYLGSGKNMAVTHAPECLQSGGWGSEDCLFLNIWTTFLPGVRNPAVQKLRPVMVYIYGGGFMTGSASNLNADGGNTASRGDVVSVNLAYRVSTMGFLALQDGVHNGNYFLSDLISGLQWIQQNIKNFGGDPSRVTIYGESAGAQAVQALLASPKAEGLFRAAIMQSNWLQPYIRISQSYSQSTASIIQSTGCSNLTTQIACLQAYSGTSLINLWTQNLGTPVIDGTYLTSSYINVRSPNNATRSVPILMGTMRDEYAVLGPLYPTSNLSTAINDMAWGIGMNPNTLMNSGIFPLGTGPGSNAVNLVFNTTTRIYTDRWFKCSNVYTAYAALSNDIFPNIYFYQFNRSYQDPGFNTHGMCTPASTAGFPNGNPSLEYFKCHAGDLANTFGVIERTGWPDRDGLDTPFSQTVLDYWTSFARTLDPNPDPGYLAARNYWNTINQVNVAGAWPSVNINNPQMMNLQWNGGAVPFGESAQCVVLNQPMDLLAPQ